MKTILMFVTIIVVLSIATLTKSEADFNGNTPGCGGSNCHSTQSGLVTTEVLDNFQVRVTVSGTTSKVGGELVNSSGTVVAFFNSTSSNPFILTAPSAGTYTVNAGYKSPSRKWGSASAVLTVTGVDEELIGLKPDFFQLYSNYPNPFNPNTKIRYAISETAYTTLIVYSILGKEVATLINEQKSPGIYEVNFEAANLPSGTYIYKLNAGSFTQTKKMIVLK